MSHRQFDPKWAELSIRRYSALNLLYTPFPTIMDVENGSFGDEIHLSSSRDPCSTSRDVYEKAASLSMFFQRTENLRTTNKTKKTHELWIMKHSGKYNEIYHLESRCRNSHVLVYHGPLLIHHLGVAPSTVVKRCIIKSPNSLIPSQWKSPTVQANTIEISKQFHVFKHIRGSEFDHPIPGWITLNVMLVRFVFRLCSMSLIPPKNATFPTHENPGLLGHN